MGIFIKIEKWDKYSKKLFAFLLFSLLLLGFLYVYFMNLAVLKTAEVNENLKGLSEMKRKIQELETSYIGKSDELTLSYAESLGFVNAKPDNYFYRTKVVVRGGNYEPNFK